MVVLRGGFEPKGMLMIVERNECSLQLCQQLLLHLCCPAWHGISWIVRPFGAFEFDIVAYAQSLKNEKKKKLSELGI